MARVADPRRFPSPTIPAQRSRHHADAYAGPHGVAITRTPSHSRQGRHEPRSASSDLIDSVADALQYISYYHPQDYIEALGAAYAAEASPAAKDAIAQILTNSRMCAEGHRPLCQDTGIVVAFVKLGMDVRWEGATMTPTEMINEGVRRAYLDPGQQAPRVDPRRPRGQAHEHEGQHARGRALRDRPRRAVEVSIAAKGGGSENKSKFVMLNPSDSIVDWVLKTVPTMGAGWCPPGMLGIGIGGSAEKAMVLAKEALMEPIDIHELAQARATNGARGACASSSSTRSTRSASARRAWADSRPCSTSRSSTIRRMPRRSRSR